MKYWRGFLAAAIFAAIAWGFVSFAQSHPVLVDMVYPYLLRIYTSSVTTWSNASSACIYQIVLLFGVVVIIASGVLMVMFKWNIVQWLGWVLAAVVGVNMLTTVSYGLNAYASPLADDIKLTISDYTATELVDTTMFFRDQVNALAPNVPRSDDNTANLGSFEELAGKAYQGFEVLTYEKAMPVFAGNTTSPVKKLSMPGLFSSKGESGVTVAITGESAVNPDVPSAALPFAMCKELSHRISIYSEPDANFAAFLACTNHPEDIYRYSGYLMAYYYCYEALLSIPTSTAQHSAKSISDGLFDLVRADLDAVYDFFGQPEATPNVQAEANITASDSEMTLITFSSYSDVTDLFVSWYIQEYILPTYEPQNPSPEFNPYDKDKVFPPEPGEVTQ